MFHRKRLERRDRIVSKQLPLESHCFFIEERSGAYAYRYLVFE